MDLNKGFPLKQKQNFETQHTWIPTTPAKTTTTSRQMNQPSGPTWLKPTVLLANLTHDTAPPWGFARQNECSTSSSIPNHLQDIKVNHASALFASGNATTMFQAPTTGSVHVNSLECWSPLLYGHVDAACNMTGTRKLPPCSPLLVPIANHLEMPATQNIMLLNGEVIFSASLLNSSNCCSNQNTEYRLPVTSLSSCDSLIESSMGVSKTATMSAPPTPATMEKFYKMMQDKQLSSELIDLVEEGARKETLMEKELCSSQLPFDKLLSDKVIILLSEEASEKPMGVQKNSIERKNSEIDLNVITPKKRPLKKKHRPKVFENGKPSRKRKPATQLEKDGNTGGKGSTSCKRKYVRRKNDVAHVSDTASNALGEVVDAEGKGEAKSVRRCLNFDLEEQWVVDEFSDAMSMFKNVLGVPALEECDGSAVTSSSVKETADSIIIPNDVAVKPSAAIISELNSSTYQSNTDCSNLLPVSAMPGEVNKNVCASVKQMPFLKSSVKHFRALARKSVCLDSAAVNFPISLEVAQRNLNPNKIYDDPPEGAKRVHLSFDEAGVFDKKRIMHFYKHEGCSRKIHDSVRKDSCPTNVHKRIRMEKWDHKEANPNVSRKVKYVASNSWSIKQQLNKSQDCTIADAPRIMVQEKVQDLESMLTFDQTEGYVQKSPVSGWGETSLCSSGSTSMMPNPVKTFKQKTKGIIKPSTPKNLSKFRDTLSNKICRNQGHLEISEEIMKSSNTRIKTSTKKQDKDLQLNLMISSTVQTFLEECEQKRSNWNFPAQNIVEGGALSTRSLSGKNLNPEIFPVDCESACYYNFPASSSLRTLVPFKNPADDIVCKLRHLSLKSSDEVSSSQAQNSIVPYIDHGGVMVAYERNFHLIKKQRPRPKVDLDPESNRVWKLLMGKECGEGDDERSDVDKEKWWDEERRVFQGRVDSFIARMHLVQGDRRFTQWKGSVVDSVVGVFLTQNVSDHLSSSAFMALAANFPLSRGKGSVPNGEKVSTSTEIPNRCIISFTDTPEMQSNLLDHASFKYSLEVNVAESEDKKETINSSETHGSISTSNITFYSRKKGKGGSLYLQKNEATSYQESTMSGSGAKLAEREDIRLLKDAITSQNSASSCQNSMNFHAPSNEHIGSNSFLNIEADCLSGSRSNDALGSSSFTKILQIAQSRSFKKFYSRCRGMISATKIQESSFSIENNQSLWSQLDSSKGDFQSCNTDSSLHHAVSPPTESSQFDGPFNSEVMANNAILFRDSRSHLLSTNYELFGGNDFEVMNNKGSESEVSVAECTSLPKILSSSKTATNIDSCMPISKLTTQVEVDANLYSASHKSMTKGIIDVTKNENPNVCSSLQTENVTTFHQDGNSIFQAKITNSAVQARDQLENCRTQQTVVSDKQIERNLDVADKAGPNLKAETRSFPIVSPETPVSSTKSRKRRSEVENKTYDWESLRKEVCCTKPAQERNSSTMDSLDWEAVRMADVSEISEAIRGRGMNNVLAERIKEFLNRLVREHGSIDLEWLRDAPPDKVKDYLLSIRGLGLKSAECVRLLTLQQLAFPVDTNVGRICVRLGWVPLQPLPESLQLHLLELYPMLATIQKYLWPRLCKLNQRTLYELHYQMITFGKVFCTKRKPNCNSCPLRGECKHFASAFASARLALPAPDGKNVVSFTAPIASEKSCRLFKNLAPLPQLEGNSISQECILQNHCEPIVEEPASPEPQCSEALESAIEDAFYEDPDEIPIIKLDFEDFTQNLQNYMEENMDFKDGSLSKALVALTPACASIPMPKLKNVSHLRTDHQVYEIPDSHQLLEGVEPREPDDPSPYLLAIWTPGETAEATEPPKACCNSLDRDQLCERSTCFTCNSIREAQSHKVRGTLLIPCRTAMRGSFPLNGTYFQVNEVFADHHSSCDPIYVPRDWIWNLPRRTAYFGTSIPTIFRGLTTEEIQQCFWRGFVCVRGFDRVSRAPRPLYARLHFPASKAPKNMKAAEQKEGK